MTPLPFIKEVEGVTFVIRMFNVEINPEINELENSEHLFMRAVKALEPERIASTNHRVVRFQLGVLSAPSTTPYILVTIEALLSSEKIIDDPKHVWNLIWECTQLLNEHIEENNVTDKNGTLISLPFVGFATEQLKGFL